jgi:hypothetical protein
LKSRIRTETEPHGTFVRRYSPRLAVAEFKERSGKSPRLLRKEILG